MMRFVASALILMLAAGTPVVGQGPDSAADAPAAHASLAIGEWHAGATVLDEMVEGLVDIEQRPWNALAFHPDGRTVDVYFAGIDPLCTQLHDLEVAIRPSGLEIVIMTGRPPDVAGCREPNRPYVVTIELEQALFGGGQSADGS